MDREKQAVKSFPLRNLWGKVTASHIHAKAAHMTAVQLTPEQARTIGERLKSAREQQGKSIADIAYQIALSPAQLRAIESADLKPFYSHSFFYQAAERYAKLLRIDLPTFDVPVSADTTPPPEPETPRPTKAAEALPTHKPTTEKKPRGWKPFALAAGVAAIAVGVVLNQQGSLKSPPEVASNASVASAPAPGPATTESSSTTATPAGASAVTPAVANASPAPLSAGAATSPPTPASPTASSNNLQSNGPEQTDSLLESAATAWVQIVKKNGDKTNIKIQPGQKIEFASVNTAAIVFGQPDKARLMVKGKTVDLNRFVTADNPTRALVILNQIP